MLQVLLHKHKHHLQALDVSLNRTTLLNQKTMKIFARNLNVFFHVKNFNPSLIEHLMLNDFNDKSPPLFIDEKVFFSCQ